MNAWDYDLALGVHYSFEKALIANLQKYIEDLQLLPEDFDMSVIKELVRKYRTDPDEPIHYAEHPTDELRDVLTNVVSDCQDLSTYGICILANSEDTIIQQSINDTIDETYQAMEAAIHNLNTLHCLPGSEEIWVSDKQQEKIRLITMKELDETFSPDRYEAFSINMDTGKVELKPIIASARKDNNRDLVTVTNKMGAKVTVTTNHKMVTINKQTGELYKAVSDEIMATIMPKGISLPKLDDTRIVISDYTDKTPRRDTPVAINSLKLTRDLAYLLGVYIGDGSVSGGSGMLLTVCEKIPTDTLVQLVRKVFGKHIEYRIYYMPDGVRVKTVSFSLGRYMCDALKNMCGHTAGTKHVPDFIVRAPKNIQREFLRGYNDTDGRHTTKYAEISSVSERLITEVNFLVHRLNETAVLSKASTRRAGYVSNYEYLNVISIAGNSARRLNLATVGLPKCEIPKYDLSYVRGLIGHSSKYIKRRKSKSVRYGELKDVIKYENRDDLTKYTRFYAVDIAEREYRNSSDEYVYDISVKDNENFMTRDCIFVSNSRAGSQVPFSSINLGTDTSDAGRLIIRKTLEAVDAGMGNGETAIFPISIFKVYDGINFKPGDPNYDLYRYAMEVTARRLFPNFVFGDAPFNYQYYRPGHPETEIVAMGCRTRVIGNVNGPEIVPKRGNCSFTTINLPRLGIKHGTVSEGGLDLDAFFADLDKQLELVEKELLDRYEYQGKKKVKNFPFLMGEGLWMDSETLGSEDTLESVIKHGTLSIGFIGLAECLVALIGKHHGESAEAQELGLKIIKHMRDYTDEATKRTHLNFSILATPSEGLSGRFVRIDKKVYGIIPGVTDREYYTNSMHCPVYYPMNAFDKIEIEAAYHPYCNAGHICYVELDGDVTKNIDAIEELLAWMKECGIGYGSLNHPVDYDPICGYVGIIGDTCPRCGRKEFEGVPIQRLKKLGVWKEYNSKYIGYTGDLQEEEDRIPNLYVTKKED